MIETVHHLGINRVEVIIKIDSRIDKQVRMEEKIESIKKQWIKIVLRFQNEYFFEQVYVLFL